MHAATAQSDYSRRASRTSRERRSELDEQPASATRRRAASRERAGAARGGARRWADAAVRIDGDAAIAARVSVGSQADARRRSRPFLLEETYEALDAIDRGDLDALPGEFGDVLFQCVFHAQIAAEPALRSRPTPRRDHRASSSAGTRTCSRPTAGRCRAARSVVPRHDARGGLTAMGSDQGERAAARATRARARRRAARAARAAPRARDRHARRRRRLRLDDTGDVVDKIDEEVRELRDALTRVPARAAEELGDLLFSIANLARSSASSRNPRFGRERQVHAPFDGAGGRLRAAAAHRCTARRSPIWRRRGVGPRRVSADARRHRATSARSRSRIRAHGRRSRDRSRRRDPCGRPARPSPRSARRRPARDGRTDCRGRR